MAKAYIGNLEIRSFTPIRWNEPRLISIEDAKKYLAFGSWIMKSASRKLKNWLNNLRGNYEH